jgi:MarR family transcriptional regulator, lower aerobic nicotinate degradation pathway regulator
VLAALADEGAAGQLTLARYLRLDPSDITTTLDDLQRRRLVERAVDPTDRRRRLVSLTVEGQTVLQGLCDLAREVADGLLAPLDDTRRDVLHSALLTVLVAARGTTREPERFGRPAPVADNRR